MSCTCTWPNVPKWNTLDYWPPVQSQSWDPPRGYSLTKRSAMFILSLKPWPNGVASRRKFSSCVHSRLRSARPCVHWRCPTLTLVEIRFACKSTHVFHRLTSQPKSAQVERRPLTCSQPMKYRIFLPCNGLLGRKRASLFGQPAQVSTKVQLVATTCESV